MSKCIEPGLEGGERRFWRPGDQLAIHGGPGEHGLEFYSGKAVRVIEDEAELTQVFKSSRGFLAIVPKDVYARLALEEDVTAIATAADAVLAASRHR